MTSVGMINENGGSVVVHGDVVGRKYQSNFVGVHRPAPRAQVLIVAALRDEYEAAREAAGIRWQERDVETSAPYLSGGYQNLTVALARPVAMGGRTTGTLATSLVNRLRPLCLAMTGVCAGNPDSTVPGDVVVADPAYEHDEGKHTGPFFQGDHRHYPQTTSWLRVVQEFDPSGLTSHGAANEQEAALWFLELLYRKQDPGAHPARSR